MLKQFCRAEAAGGEIKLLYVSEAIRRPGKSRAISVEGWGFGKAKGEMVKQLLTVPSLPKPLHPDQYICTCSNGMSVDHASAVAAPKSDPVFLHVKAGITVIVTDTEGAWRMADVDTGVINWINADLVTHIVPRC